MPSKLHRPEVGLQVNQKDPLIRSFLAYAHMLARYHRHRVLHLERLGALLRRGRRVVLVGNHALDILDPLLFTTALIDRYGRIPNFIGHENMVFRLPGLGDLAKRYQMIPSRQMGEADTRAARQRASSCCIRARDRRRPGAVTVTSPIGSNGRNASASCSWRCAAMPRSCSSPPWASTRCTTSPRWRFPWRCCGSSRRSATRAAGMQFGTLGPHLLPTLLSFPVQITHVVSKPLDLGDRQAARRSRAALVTLHQRVAEECQQLLDAAVARRERTAPLLDRTVRAGERWLQRIGV